MIMKKIGPGRQYYVYVDPVLNKIKSYISCLFLKVT